jgi:electron transport complex protein RnfE
VAGVLVSLLSGSRFQIGGPTGAFVVIVFGVIQRHGYDGLALATLMAGGLGMGLGFTVALVALGGAREILGKGSFFGVSLFGPEFEPWIIMILPPGGFLMLGFLLLLFAWGKEAKEKLRSAASEERAA